MNRLALTVPTEAKGMAACRRATAGLVRTIATLALCTGVAFAAKPPPQPPTCTIAPSNGTASVGVPVTFTVSVQNLKGGKIYDWTFSGPASPTSSSQQSQAVTYSATGTYGISVHVSSSKGECTDSTNITVGNAQNNPPVANNDSYDTTDGETLSVGAPGVLANDQDETPATLTANLVANAGKGNLALDPDGSFIYTYTGTGPFPDTDTFTYRAEDDINQLSNTATVTITIAAGGVVGGNPVGRGDTYATAVSTPLDVTATRISGVLYNDFDTDAQGNPIPDSAGTLTANLVSGTTNGSLNLNSDGSFSYTPNSSLSDNDNDSFTYQAEDANGNLTAVTTVNINILSKQTDFKIMMNYELGMHCTGFEFAYCCVLPPYNSIITQVVKPQSSGAPVTGADYPRLLEGDHGNTDGLGRPVVMRDAELDGNGNFKKYFLEYYHDAQPRLEGQGKVQTSTLISAVEGNSLFYHQTLYDSALIGANGELVTGLYEGAGDIVLGDGDFNDPTDNYANGWLNHFYIYADLEGSNPTGSTQEADKIRLGVTGHIEYPADVGAALQPMGPTGSAAGFDNVLTYSGDTGTVVYTQMKVLENLPVMLTSPDLWEALGLPLTPFEDSVDFFGDPGLVDEDSVRPYVAMKARLHTANCDADGLNCTQGGAVIGSNGKPVIGFGTAPIDIPNCERCHSVPATDGQGNPNTNSPSYIRSDFGFPHGGAFAGASLEAVTAAEKSFWDAYYNIIVGVDSDWYSRLKGAAINMLSLHDFDNNTGFTANWPSGTANDPVVQNTRLGKESVICQKCHADSVIAVVKSGSQGTSVIKPISEAIHWRHREISEGGTIDFADAAGRSGGCQGCHPAHRSDGVMDGYPITLAGENEEADGDNRLAAGGCFVGRDVHSNAMKDVDGAETPAHLNAVGQYLADNVFYNQDGEAGVAGHDTRGLWCTNCHTQLGQEMWKTENCPDLINGDCITDPRGASSLAGVAAAVGVSEAQAIAWLDPTADNPLGDFTHAIWEADPGLCEFLVNPQPAHDAKLATVEVSIDGQDGNCSTGAFLGPVDCSGVGGPVFNICGSYDGDPGGAHPAGDFSVNILDFCTTDDCVSAAQGNLVATTAVPVPFSAATDARDHWLSPGEPHCADCHTAPFVEPSGGNAGEVNAWGESEFRPPFNYPRKASLMRYSTGHQGVTCQGCHESIHGLYPVTPTIDTTSYAQAAALNHDGSHGPLKCGTCHEVDGDGIPTWISKGRIFGNTFDEVVTWAHTYTEDADPLDETCLNCHGDRRSKIGEEKGKWLRHSYVGRIGRLTQDKAEISQLGHVAGDPDTNGDGTPDRTAQDIANTVCSSCHSQSGGPSGDFLSLATCDNATWKQHLVQGRLAEKVWEFISEDQNGTTCGW